MTVLPPVLPPVFGNAEIAWLAMLPTTSPALTSAEQARVRAIKATGVDPRVVARATAVLSANGTP